MLMFRRIVGRVASGVALLGLYLPIIAGLITPMAWLLPAWYFSWDLLSYVVPFSERWHGILYFFHDGYPEGSQIALIVAFRLSQFLLFCIGVSILCYGLFTLTRVRAGREGLTTSGPYRWIRHPQHLGIFLMLFLLAFPLWSSYSDILLPATRPGEMISISSVGFLLLLIADLEDYKMASEYGNAYVQYRVKTPFILPIRIQIPESLQTDALKRGRPLRYILAFLGFWIWLMLLSYYFTFVPLDFVR